MSIRTHLTRAGAAATLATLVIGGATMPRAEAAVDPATIIAAAKTAYSAYQLVQDKDDVAAATTKIINAINSARTQLIAHMDALATIEAESCSRNALFSLSNMATMSEPTAEQFAISSDKCVNTIKSLISTLTDKAAVDRAGFALNAVGPIALIAAANAEMDDSLTKTSLRSANQTLVKRLAPSCQATPLLGDAEPGGIIEVMLRCKAYNGDVGTDTAFVTSPTGNTYNFTLASNQATRRTSRAVAQAVLPKI